MAAKQMETTIGGSLECIGPVSDRLVIYSHVIARNGDSRYRGKQNGILLAGYTGRLNRSLPVQGSRSER